MLICWSLAVGLGTAAEVLAGDLVLDSGRHEVDLLLDGHGAQIRASAPAELAGRIALRAEAPAGLQATVIADSLRRVDADDWRGRADVVGQRQDLLIDFDRRMGSEAERRRWGIAGRPDNWDRVSIQWDGYLRVPAEGWQLAIESDDGSRVWLDRDHDGAVDADEWGSNGWGSGHGAQQRIVHDDLPPGTYRLRVQWEEGGGGNCCILRWRAAADRPWEVVPTDAFRAAPDLQLSGPLRLTATVSGTGLLRLADGVRLAATPQVPMVLDGELLVDRSLDLSGTALAFVADARLALQGQDLRLGAVTGPGVIALQGGRLTLPAGRYDLMIRGPGELRIPDSAADGTGMVRLAALGPDVTMIGGGVQTGTECRTRTRLTAPLTTILRCADAVPGPLVLQASITVPDGAPSDLGVGAWRADRQGRWFQRVHPERLGPGRHDLQFRLDAAAQLQAAGHAGHWSADAAADAGRLGLFFFSAAEPTSAVEVAITARWSPVPADEMIASPPAVLTDLQLGPRTAPTGERWSLALRPQPYPTNPYDPTLFSLDLEVTQPDGSRVRYAGFHDQPVAAVDRGDLEVYRDAGRPCFRVRFRPRQPGRHGLVLHARWAGGSSLRVPLPDLLATGEPWDDIVRVDPSDGRFFSVDGRFIWPLGCNLNSVYDTRSRDRLGTRMTPDRGSVTRSAYLRRLAAGGADACEIWLSPWNLGLEWIPAWPGFRGAGRYHAGNAWAIDQFLNEAEELGVRVTVVIFNHGMARDGRGAEHDWPYHPYNEANGGWLQKPAGLFDDQSAFAYQQRLFRYLAARYGDSPAVLGWKLWAEVDLADASRDLILDWHARASAALAMADPWDHPITSHWCGTWRRVDQRIGALPTIDWLTIDAYKGDDHALADLLGASTRDPERPELGLAHLGKPVLVAEYGGSSGGSGHRRLLVEHAIGPWVALVTGHAGGPMLWWFEWIDQHDRFAVYQPPRQFLQGEDLRHPAAQSQAPTTTDPTALWCRVWRKPQRALGYLLDREWGMGGAESEHDGVGIELAEDEAPGAMVVEWWDPDTGALRQRQRVDHAGGILALTAPAFQRHMAFKWWRVEGDELADGE